MEQDINPTKGTYVRTLTMDNNLLDCKRARFRADNVNAKIKITNARVIKGDTVQPWSVAQEDLQAHSLTANLRFEGTYINNITNNVKAYLDVFYDGQKVSSGFNAQVKYKGCNRTDWSGFWNANFDNNGGITNLDWGNREQNGTPLEAIVLVTYKGLNTIANARLDNLPDPTEIKEITKKYKTFESTIDQFNSTIGEVKQQVLANEEKRNLILGSRMISASDYNNIGNADLITSQEYDGLPFLSIFSNGNTSKVWKGVGFNLSIQRINKGETYSIKIPIFISDTMRPDEGAYLEIKNHDTQESLWNTRLDVAYLPAGQWNVHKYTFIASKDINLSKSSFYIHIVKNGYLALAKPYMCAGDSLPKNYSPAPEDVYLQNSRLESSIVQTKEQIDLKVSKDNIISAINLSVERDKSGNNQGLVKINADKVDISGTLKAYTGNIGSFYIGNNTYAGYGKWITGTTHFNVGMSDGTNGDGGAAFWVNWGYDWSKAGEGARYVTNAGNMYAKRRAYLTGGIDTGRQDIYGYATTGKVGPTSVMWWNQIDSVRSSSSDKRLKTNIKPTKVKALDTLNNIEMVEFNWKKDNKFEKIGAIAQQVNSVDENLVVIDEIDKSNNNYLRIKYYDIIPYLIKGIQELSEENTNLKSQLKEMNKKLNKLEDKINGKL